MADNRPSTPPRSRAPAAALSPLTPEAVRRMEVNRLKAKAAREQRESEVSRPSSANRSHNSAETGGSAGQKRNHAAYQESPTSYRDARAKGTSTSTTMADRPLDSIQKPARNAAKYYEYDFSKMTDTKGGFLTAEDDPHNKAMKHFENDKDGKPGQMTEAEWQRQRLAKSLRNTYDPVSKGVSVMKDEVVKKCRECGTVEYNYKWDEIFGLTVCDVCKEKLPEKYSLLTKTEAREDYLLTNPELNDETILPHMERPNPHKSNWSNMFLYVRCQVEDYAFSSKRWGSAEALDAEFERRQIETKRRKENKFKSKLADLKKRTKIEAYQRNKRGGAAKFGDDLSDGRHVHEFGRAVDNPETGMPVKTCIECGLEVEELDL